MNEKSPAIRWGVEQRLEFIEFRLFWEGGINRGDIIEMFGVSVPQASRDLAMYQDTAPGNVDYDKSAKRYVPSHTFRTRFLRPDPSVYLSRLRVLGEGLSRPEDSWVAHVPEIDVAVTPHRIIDTEILRSVLTAMRERRSLDVCYQSMNTKRPDPVWRRITPHAFGYDGFRWHTRAFCHLENRFKDFLLPRILEAGSFGDPVALGDKDTLWQEYVGIEIAPHPQLTDSQKKVVAKDYGMSDGSMVLRVRNAMLFYVLKRLGLLGDAEKEDARRQHIVVVNKTDVQSALARSEIIEFNTEADLLEGRNLGEP
ncbi:WYL domain-containing protein [Sulfitobacter sp.]|uniref:WYL domain-containing protein n=1 Tax=Sulfitobacter sp. TaxID=1903071 RepID=UPI0025E79643|nr:WYL domain-containing protein [Sulfitobacter sp.]